MTAPPTTSTPSGFPISPQLIVGILIIFVGVIFTLDEFGYAPAIGFLKFWPLGLIAIGVIKMLQARDGGGAFVGLMFSLVGVWLQSEALGYTNISLRDIWPLGLVLFGGYLVWQGLTKPRPAPPAPFDPSLPADVTASGTAWDIPPSPPQPAPDGREAKSAKITDTNSTMTAMAILGGVSRGNNSRAFRGADLLAIMGGCEIDLRKAAINGEAVVDVFAMWGGIEIRVPEDWTVVSQVFPLMGGVDDKTRPPQNATAHRLVLRGFAIMGGIEIKN
jgi:cell wall-active antibiotic response 4TMS protein YvqF